MTLRILSSCDGNCVSEQFCRQSGVGLLRTALGSIVTPPSTLLCCCQSHGDQSAPVIGFLRVTRSIKENDRLFMSRGVSVLRFPLVCIYCIHVKLSNILSKYFLIAIDVLSTADTYCYRFITQTYYRYNICSTIAVPVQNRPVRLLGPWYC